jgi:hypothetical protein
MAKVKMAGKQNRLVHAISSKGCDDYNNKSCALARCLSVACAVQIQRMVAAIPQPAPSSAASLRQISRRVDANAKVGIHPSSWSWI